MAADIAFARSVSAAGFRKLAVDHLCRHFDRADAVLTFVQLENARQRLVMAMAAESDDVLRGEVGDLAKLIRGARLDGDDIQRTVDLIRAEFGIARREKLQAQGWIV